MLEFLLVVYILLAFVFPLHMLGLAVCIGLAYMFFRKYQLFRHQPLEGKKILWLSMALQSANWILSLLLSLAMAFGVHWVFVENRYLFAFNLVFSLAISVRWFDFTQRVYKYFVTQWQETGSRVSSLFAVCRGFRSSSGAGLGTPLFLDAGYLVLQDTGICFEGLFFKHKFLPAELSQVGRKSSEKIKISFSTPPHPFRPDTLLIVLKDQFHPFKSRPVRDEIYRSLENQQPRPEVDLIVG